MRQRQGSYLAQSHFYSPAFNAAIFDGPIRIYFAQHQESSALRIYFSLKEQLKEFFIAGPGRMKAPQLFIMLYPTKDTFDICFGPHTTADQDSSFPCESLDGDYVLGLTSPLSDPQYEALLVQIDKLMRSSVSPAHPEVMASL